MEDELHLTQTGMLCGTPLYMSPEQASAHPMDARSDLYSLGATYYALLTGRPPFLAGGVPQILMSHVSKPTPDPRLLVAEIPEACVRVLMRAMEKDCKQRYQSAAEMGSDMEAILAGIPQRNISIFDMEESAPVSAAMSAAAVAGSPSFVGQSIGNHSQTGTKHQAPKLSRRGFFTVFGLGALGLGGAGVYGFYALRARRTANPVVATVVPVAVPSPLPPIKVGILHSLSGALAVSERPLADAAVLAIEELNESGGLLGRQVQPALADGKSEVTADSAFTRAAERLLVKEKVAAVFGGYGSAGRKAIRTYFEKYDQLLFYPAQYEGLEESQNIIYTGATPNQLAVPALRFCVNELRAKRFFLIGTDGLRARAINAIVEDNLKELGGEVVGSHYALVGEYHFAPVVKKIKHAKPQIIINMLVGDSIVAFFEELGHLGITPQRLPVLSFTLGENELSQLSNLSLAGHYVARTRFQPLLVSGEPTFAQRFMKKYGSHRPVSEVMEAAYYGVHLWAAAVRRAQSDDVSKVRIALKEKEYDLKGARVLVDPSNQHTWKVFQIARIINDNRIEVIKTGDSPIPPIPFPGPRTRAEWQAFSESLYEKWGENWANPLKPRVQKSSR